MTPTVRVGLRPLPKRARLQRRSGTVWNGLFISHCAFSNYPTKYAVITSIFEWEEEPGLSVKSSQGPLGN